MSDEYEKLIQSVKFLKEQRKKKEDKIASVAEDLQKQEEDIKNSYSKINDLLSQIKNEISSVEKKKNNLINAISPSKNEEKVLEEKKLSYKKFYIRESLLTILLRKDNYRALYNLFLSWLIMNAAIYGINAYTNKGQINLIRTLSFGEHLRGFAIFLKYAGVKILYSILFIFLTNILGSLGNYVTPISFFIFVFAILLNRTFFPTDKFSFLTKILHYWDNINFVLKFLAYYCEKKLYISYKCYQVYHKKEIVIDYSKGIVIKDNGDNDEIIFEWKRLSVAHEIKNYFRFYFLPTLIYRDSYPKLTKGLKNPLKHFINSLLCSAFIFVEVANFALPLLEEKTKSLTYGKFWYLYVSFTLYSVIGMFVLIFGYAHSFCNLASELFNFGDRNFYGDFYNATTPKMFLQKIAYIYNDFCDFYIFPLLKYFLLNNKSEKFRKTIKDLTSILFYSIIFDYLIGSCIETSSPFITMFLMFCLAISIPLSNFSGDYALLLNWILLTSEAGLVSLTMGTEMYYNVGGIKGVGLDFNSMSFIGRHLPKLYFLIKK